MPDLQIERGCNGVCIDLRVLEIPGSDFTAGFPLTERMNRGESVLVSISARHPTNREQAVEIAVNGVPGNPQYVQFRGPLGTRFIHVTACTSDGQFDLERIPVNVIAPEQPRWSPELQVRFNPFQHLVADFE